MPDTKAPTQPAFRAAVRSKSTRWSVVYGERIAKAIITVGGLMVIVAVLGIMLFLFSVVAPLLSRGEEQARYSYTLSSAQNMAWVNADEFQTLATGISADGRLVTFHVPTGREILRETLDFGGATATAVGGVLTRDSLALGFEDGTVRFATLEFNVTTTARGNVPQGLERIDGRDLLRDTSILTEVQTGDFRTITPAAEVGDPLQVSEHAIIALDYTVGGTVERPVIAFATIDAENVARISQSRIQRNLMTGQETVTTTSAELPGLDLPAGVSVTGILLARGGDRVFVSTDDGVIYRYDARNMNAPILAEQRRVLPDGVAITAVQLLSGDQSLVIGGEDGSVEVFFRLQRADAPTADGYELVHARTHANQGSAVLEITQAQRDKSFATLGADGTVKVRHSTSDQTLFTLERESHRQSDAVMMIFPRSNGVLLVDASGAVDVLAYDAPHPEITPRVLFGKVWYESYSEPGFTWQSTAGTDLAEPKYSLVPLVFGTIKAAFYAMLFATPISIMAAIYTSEFVHSSVRSTVKPVMELMESLPTVVLGFLAALVIAPLVEEWIAAVLLGFIAVPMGLMLGAFVWQMLPVPVALRYNGLPKFALMAVMIITACLVAYALGPLFELALFDGDFKAWTNGAGDGTPFMFLLQLPLAYLVVSWGFHRIYGHFLRDRMRAMDRPAAGRLDFLRWIAFFFAAMALSYAVALSLSALGFDPRGNVVDSYQQRNALVVGFAMAFAVIPSIYTLCEDALNSVPSHLRAGSLAAGATPWQTAKWIVLPTAASGVFSAVMMGMGRAVGETMIVVMAAGNTPIMEWNIFSGLRTLSANIAIELPEAVKDGTNYRVLFLAALTLFLMTFFINTIAELIRQRFRKRAFNL